MLMFYKHISMFNYFFWRWSLHFFFQKKVGNKNDTGYWYTVTSVTKFIRFLCCILIWYIILNILTLTHSKTFQKADRNTFKLPIINSNTNRNGKIFVQKSNADKYKFINVLMDSFVFYIGRFCLLSTSFSLHAFFRISQQRTFQSLLIGQTPVFYISESVFANWKKIIYKIEGESVLCIGFIIQKYKLFIPYYAMTANWIGKYNSYLINKTNDAICFMVKEASRCSRDFEK